MTISRKVFSASCELPAATATSLATLMRDSILHWGLESDLISPSMDSMLGSEVGVVPEADVYVGIDANVRDANASPLYKGVTILAAENYSLQDFGADFGLIDPQQIWFYSAGGTNLDITYQGR